MCHALFFCLLVGGVLQQEEMSDLILFGYFFPICWGRAKDDMSDDEI